MSDKANAVVTALIATIPPKQYNKFKDWQVKQVVITRSSGGGGTRMPGIHVKDDAKRPSDAKKKLSRMGTSKIHKFQPSVSVIQALTWLSEYGSADASLLFDNNCSAIFEQGKYIDFEDIRDEEDEHEGGGGTGEGTGRGGKQGAAVEEDDDDEDEKDRPQTIEGEKFRIGSRDDD